MASDRQIQANQRNAKLSTGPRTPKGKATSSQNAITYGLTALISTLPTENEEEFCRMRDMILEKLMPKTQLELATRIASISWRLRRVPVFETLMMFGKSIEGFLDADFSGKITRYETTLKRQLTSLLSELRDMQSPRVALESKLERINAGFKITRHCGRGSTKE